MAGITSDLAKKSGDPLGGSLSGLRMISAGTTLLVHTVVTVKSTVKILSIFVAFLENANFNMQLQIVNGPILSY